MNINSFFREDLSTAEDRAALMRNDLWHIIVAAMNVAPAEMKVGEINFNDTTVPADVELLNNVGFLVGRAMSAYSYRGNKAILKHRLGLIGHPFSLRLSSDMSSTRAKYVAGKIRSKTDSTLRDSITQAVHYAKLTPHAVLNRAAHNVLEKLNGGRVPRTPFAASLSASVVTQLVRMFTDDMQRSEMSAADTAEIRKEFDKFKKDQVKVDEIISAAREFFSRDKWVIISGLTEDSWTSSTIGKGRVIVGAISCQPLLAAIDDFARKFVLPSHSMGMHSFAYCQEIVPFTLYTSFEKVPEDIRKSIEVELMMRKVARGTDSIYPKVEMGTTNVWQEGGQTMWRDYGEGAVLIVDKT